MPRRIRPVVALVLFAALTSPASAALNWTVSASAAGGGDPSSGLTIGDRLILDIGVTTTVPEALGLTGAVANYDRSIVVPNIAESTIPDSLFGVCFGPDLCFGGLDNNNQGLGPFAPREEMLPNGAWQLVIFESFAIAPAAGDGTGDMPFPQFQIVFDVVGGGATTLDIGSFPEFGGGYVTTGDSTINNASVSIITPEPGTGLLVGLGLCALSARRRLARG